MEKQRLKVGELTVSGEYIRGLTQRRHNLLAQIIAMLRSLALRKNKGQLRFDSGR